MLLCDFIIFRFMQVIWHSQNAAADIRSRPQTCTFVLGICIHDQGHYHLPLSVRPFITLYGIKLV